MKRTLAWLICLCLALTMLAGCGGSGIEQYENEDAQSTEAPEETGGDDGGSTEEPEPTATPEPGLGYAAYGPDEVVATFNGKDVTWREYYYFLAYYEQYIRYLSSLGAISFSGWDGFDLMADTDNAHWVRQSAQSSLFQFCVMDTVAEQTGVALDEADEAALQQMFEQNADSYSGDGDGTCTDEEAAAFEEYLDGQFVDRALFDKVNGAGLLWDKAFTALYGENGADYPDADALAYAEEQGIMSVKHILLLTVDTATGEALSDEEIAGKKVDIDEMYQELSALEGDRSALEARFDELMNEKSEDTGLAANPDGYLFGPGVMVSEFEDTASALEEYGLSEPIQSSYGYHIILRLPVDPDGTVMTADGSNTTPRYAAADNAFYARVMQAVADGEVTWNGDFEDLDMDAVFGG